MNGRPARLPPPSREPVKPCLAGTLAGRVLPLNLGRGLALGQLECQTRGGSAPALPRSVSPFPDADELGPAPAGAPPPVQGSPSGPRGPLRAAHRAGMGPAGVAATVRGVRVAGARRAAAFGRPPTGAGGRRPPPGPV